MCLFGPIATATSNNLHTPLSLGTKRANVHVPGHNFRYKKRRKAAVKTQESENSDAFLQPGDSNRKLEHS